MEQVNLGHDELEAVVRRPAGQAETLAGNRRWWDAEAEDYLMEHGSFLGDAELVWGPEGVREEDARLLGDVQDRDVLEFGGGAGQCARWAALNGARVVSTDLSRGMIDMGLALNDRVSLTRGDLARVPFVQADACALPFRDASFDVVFSSYGAVPFVADPARIMREAARVLRPGGRLVFSTTHPFRWCLPDVPGEEGLTVTTSYFDTKAYVEETSGGRVRYAEHHATIGSRISDIVTAGLVLVDLLEPEWPADNPETWGGWSPLRGALVPGTAVYVAERPGGSPAVAPTPYSPVA